MESKKNVLILDTEPENSSKVFSLLKDKGYALTHLNDLNSIKNLDIKIKPDLILCKTYSSNPDNNNCTFLEKINKELNTPIIILTRNHDPELYLKALEHGVSNFILMPCTESFLLNTIENVCNDTSISINNGEARTFTARHNDKEYTITIHHDHLFYSFLSLVESSIHQNIFLQSLLKKKPDMPGLYNNKEILDDNDACIFSESALENELLMAHTNKEFQLYYQPVISLSDNSVVGFEALIRWIHPERGIVGPDEFIPIIEEMPIIIPLGYWIVEEVTRLLKTWQDKYSIINNLRLNINLSARQFINQGLSDEIINIVEASGIDPSCIGLEITESAFMEDMEAANLALLKLKAKNFALYMDDFGTGYSSLSYLQHFPVDVLKIDKSFVQWMHIDEQSEEIVRLIILLAHNLKKKVVAEGVQEKEHISLLKKLNCEYIQGYYISKPLNAEEAEEFFVKSINK